MISIAILRRKVAATKEIFHESAALCRHQSVGGDSEQHISFVYQARLTFA